MPHLIDDAHGPTTATMPDSGQTRLLSQALRALAISIERRDRADFDRSRARLAGIGWHFGRLDPPTTEDQR